MIFAGVVVLYVSDIIYTVLVPQSERKMVVPVSRRRLETWKNEESISSLAGGSYRESPWVAVRMRLN